MYVAKTLFYLSSLSHWMILLTSRHSEQIYTQSTAAAAATASVRVRAGCTSVLAGSHSGCDAAGHGLDAVVEFGEPAGGCGDSDGFRAPLPPSLPPPSLAIACRRSGLWRRYGSDTRSNLSSRAAAQILGIGIITLTGKRQLELEATGALRLAAPAALESFLQIRCRRIAAAAAGA